MYEGYHKLSNAHALQAVTKTPSLPHVQLGIGDAEQLQAQPNLVHYPTIPKAPVLQDLYTIPIESATLDGQGGQLFTPQDFPASGFIGNQIGGV